jgi:hypothetical protein
MNQGSTHRVEMRLLTALMIIGLCVFAVLRWWAIVQFAEARDSVPVKQAEPAKQAEQNTVGGWTGAVPGLRTATLERALRQSSAMTDVASSRNRVDLLSRLLSEQPMSSSNWFSLAGMR